MPRTYSTLYIDIRKELRRSGSPAASLEARELVCFGSGKTREELLRDGGLYVPTEVEEQILALVKRHLNGEPVAYLIGEWEFYGLPLTVNPSVLIPRVDTEVLAEAAIEHLKTLPGGGRVLDLCAGSGCIGLAIAANVPEVRVLLGELSENAIRVCRENIRRNELLGRVSVMSMNALEPPSPNLGEFDVIVSNPPYIPASEVESLDGSVKDFEPHMALNGGADGYDFYRFIIPQWKKALKEGGKLLFEVGIHQAETVKKLLEENDFCAISVLPDGQGIDRVVMGERRRETNLEEECTNGSEETPDGFSGGSAGQ